MQTILFINKKRSQSQTPGEWGYTADGPKSSGLANSVEMVVKMLQSNDIMAVAEEAIDNNCIDRLITKHRPACVIIEALWVVPEKFAVLHKLHPQVKFIVRLHSEIPFLASEGMAMGWLQAYTEMSYVTIAANSLRILRSLQDMFKTDIMYLPNWYDTEHNHAKSRPADTTINISCFGAVRPLKNHLTQAVAAILYANKHGLTLRFHINGTRVEGKGSPALKNLRELFARQQEHTLVEHEWYDHADFKQVIRDQIDIGMQVSFTESYNIVLADHIDCGVPVVSSPEISFVCSLYHVSPTDIDEMVHGLERAACCTRWTKFQYLNTWKLGRANVKAEQIWLSNFRCYR